MPAESVIADLTVKSPARLLAEALRVKLGSSPSDMLAGPPAGTLEVTRAYMPIYQLQDTEVTVVTLVPGSQSGEINTRSGAYRTRRTVSVSVSVQRLLALDPTTPQGTAEIDELMDYSERVLRACYTRIADQNDMPFAPSGLEVGEHDEDALSDWTQFAQVHSISYETIA